MIITSIRTTNLCMSFATIKAFRCVLSSRWAFNKFGSSCISVFKVFVSITLFLVGHLWNLSMFLNYNSSLLNYVELSCKLANLMWDILHGRHKHLQKASGSKSLKKFHKIALYFWNSSCVTLILPQKHLVLR